jgi:hypothetical protein
MMMVLSNLNVNLIFLKSFGCPCGLVELSKIKTIILNKTNEYQFIEICPFSPPQKELSTVSLQMLGEYGNGLNASHCQEGQDETINDIKRIHL